MRWLFRYEQKDTVIHRLDPRVKLVWLFGLSILTVVLGVPWLLLGVLLSTLPLWFMLRPSMNKVRAIIWLFGAIMMGLCVPHIYHCVYGGRPVSKLYRFWGHSTHLRGAKPQRCDIVFL